LSDASHCMVIISETKEDSSGNIMDAYGGLVSLSSSQP